MAVSLTGIHHVSIVVSDMERSRKFYTHVLGLREIPRPKTFDFFVVWYDLGGQHIHLIPRDKAEAASPRHFALHVSDSRTARNRFQELGVSVRETTSIPGCDRFFVQDPDGNLIEIMQWFRPYCPETDGTQDGQATPPPPTDRFEPGFMKVGDVASAEIRAK
ncbi:MAG: VOC family protein [Planctomycetes bacterium]|nr:VOC family protein [Planctomycetota bacterium]